jgi:long-chain acyl-CoA synthetase
MNPQFAELLPKRPWLALYPDGVPAELPKLPFQTLGEGFLIACKRWPERIAFSSMGETLTYRELEECAKRFGGWLQQDAKFKPGDRLAIMLPNVLQYPVVLFGAFLAGITVVNCNPLYTPRELEHQLKDSKAKGIVVLENFAATVQAVANAVHLSTIITTQVGDLFSPSKRRLTYFAVKHINKMVPAWTLPSAISLPTVLCRGQTRMLSVHKTKPEELAFLQYTGGTTGVSKGAMLTHGNVVANLFQTTLWMRSDDRLDANVASAAISALPLYHIFAMGVMLIQTLDWGAASILIVNPKDLNALVKEMKRQPWQFIAGVNTLFRALLDHPDIEDLKGQNIKWAIGGGMATQRVVSDRWQKVFGFGLNEGFGLTECSPFVSANEPNIRVFTGTCGMPFPSTEVTIRNDDGDEIPLTSDGEIWIRGPQVMKGYWNRPDETAKVLTKDGWLKTGDIGHITQEGRLKITDRKKDMIIVSGFNVYPNEIEDVVAAHPGVLEVAAIGVDDERSGQAVKIVVVRKDPTLTAEQLIAHCRANLTGYKLPKVVQFTDQPLPKTAVGKILRRMVRDQDQAAAKKA